jgi:hypothetical protein
MGMAPMLRQVGATPPNCLDIPIIKARWDQNIGQAAQASGVTAKMIRHYESIGQSRRPSGRTAPPDYDANDIHTLRFIRRAGDSASDA